MPVPVGIFAYPSEVTVPEEGIWIGSSARIGVAGISAAFAGGVTTWAGSTAEIGVAGTSGSFLTGAVWDGSTATVGVAGTSGAFSPGPRTWVGSTATVGVAGTSGVFVGISPKTWVGSTASVGVAGISGTFSQVAATGKLLPPAGKIYLGVDYNGRTGYTATGAKTPHINHDYATSGTDFTNDLTRCPTGMIQLENFKPLGAMGPDAYDDILAGLANSNIDAAALKIKNYGKQMFFAPLHEPENDDTGGADAAYASAFRYIVDRVRAQGANPVVVWNMMGFEGHGSRYNTLYPGDSHVDWIGADPYVRTSTTIDTWKEFFDTGSGSFPGFYTWAKPKNKPFMLCEWGIGVAVVNVVGPKLLRRAQLDVLVRDFPLVRALVYWNAVGTVDYTLANFPPGLWQTFTEQPEFNW